MIILPSVSSGVVSSSLKRFSPTDIAGLLAFWNLNNSNGLSAIPADFGNYTLNVQYGYTSVAGKVNQAFYFDGDYGEGLWTNEQLWNLLTNPTSFTVSYWIKLSDVSYAFTLMGNAFGSLGFHFDYISDDSYYGSPNYGFTMNMSTTDGPYNWQRTFAKEVASANIWYHIVGTYDYSTTTMKLYVNGILKDTNTGAVIGENSVPSWHGFAINGSVMEGEKEYGANEYFDALGFWTRALTQAEVTALYNNNEGAEI